jgi:hypothetical protein
MRTYLPAPRRTASASMSAVHACPLTTNVACDHAHRLKPCAIAPVTPLRAYAFAAIAGKASGASPGMTSCSSFHRAVFHSLAFGSFGAIPHNSSAAGHRPKRKTTRAASAAACVPTWAPIEAVLAVLIAGTQLGLRAAASCVFCLMVWESPEVTSASGPNVSNCASAISSATRPRCAATRLATAVPMPVPIST